MLGISRLYSPTKTLSKIAYQQASLDLDGGEVDSAL